MKYVSETYYVQRQIENSFHQNTSTVQSHKNGQLPISWYHGCGDSDHVSHAKNFIIHSQSLNIGLKMIM